jgi:hypothetical protein
MHEAQLHETNYFATLTYNDETVPRELRHDHYQKFMKRLRKKFGPIPYYMCGEYGETTGRPHYHAILFGLQLRDLELYSETKGNKLYTSKELSRVWTDGYITVGAVTMDSAMYVASYCTKKLNISNKSTEQAKQQYKEKYSRIDTETGEMYEIEKEYSKMSLRPAIGKRWIQKYKNDVYNYDHVIINGRPQRPPRYYDKYLNETEPIRKEQLAPERIKRVNQSKERNTEYALKSAEQNTIARLNMKRRTL